VGVISAYIFTWIPEWTAWMIIVCMALYDIAAVLLPGGPLKVGISWGCYVQLYIMATMVTLVTTITIGGDLQPGYI